MTFWAKIQKKHRPMRRQNPAMFIKAFFLLISANASNTGNAEDSIILHRLIRSGKKEMNV